MHGPETGIIPLRDEIAYKLTHTHGRLQIEGPTNSATARNTSSNHLRLQKAESLLSAANNQATRRNEIKKATFNILQLVQAANDMHPACPNKKQNPRLLQK